MSHTLSERTVPQHAATRVYDPLYAVLDRIAPLTLVQPGMSVQDRIRALGEAINTVVDCLTDPAYQAHSVRLDAIVDRVCELAVTGSDIEVQIGFAGDLRVNRKGRLVVEDVLRSCECIPAETRMAAFRNGTSALQRILALLLQHGWVTHAGSVELESSYSASSTGTEAAAREVARQAIIATVQGLEV